MKKIFLFLFICLFTASPSFASDKIHVKALSEFNSVKPQQNFKVEVIESGNIENIQMIEGDIINCTLEKVTDPKRAKRDAKIYLHVVNYQDKLGTHEFNSPYSAKYAKTIVNVQEVKKIPPRKIAKKAISTASGFFIKGGSYAVSFADGFVQNQEDNRLKSGVKEVYDDSFLSLVEKGNEVNINIGDVMIEIH